MPDKKTGSDEILKRLLVLHPKIIDLSLGRMNRLLERLDNPQNKLPPVIHVGGTNGKGSTIAVLRSIIEAAGLSVHSYTSPHLVRFHERIRLSDAGGSSYIGEPELSSLLKECEQANGAEPITFFEITTAAAFLAFSRQPADYLLLEVGLGGRLDATNVIDKPAASVITPVSIDHQQYLGETLSEIAGEKAGILKRNVPAIIASQFAEAADIIRSVGARAGARMFFAEEDWHCYEEHGRLVYSDENQLLDLPLPALPGTHQIGNAGTAIAVLQQLRDDRINHKHIATGLKTVKWRARMQRLENGPLYAWAPFNSEIWLDGGHNAAAGRAIAQAMAEMNDSNPRPLILIIGMLNTKDPIGFFESFEGLASVAITVAIPGEENALSAEVLANIANQAGIDALPVADIKEALNRADEFEASPRILIGGSLYLAGQVLALHENRKVSAITGTSKSPG